MLICLRAAFIRVSCLSKPAEWSFVIVSISEEIKTQLGWKFFSVLFWIGFCLCWLLKHTRARARLLQFSQRWHNENTTEEKTRLQTFSYRSENNKMDYGPEGNCLDYMKKRRKENNIKTHEEIPATPTQLVKHSTPHCSHQMHANCIFILLSHLNFHYFDYDWKIIIIFDVLNWIRHKKSLMPPPHSPILLNILRMS